MTKNEREWAKKRAMGELKDFAEYTMEDPMPLLVGAGTTLVLLAVGSWKITALAAGVAVTGVLYVCGRKPRTVTI